MNMNVGDINHICGTPSIVNSIKSSNRIYMYKKPRELYITFDGVDKVVAVNIPASTLSRYGFRFEKWMKWTYRFGLRDLPSPNQSTNYYLIWNTLHGYNIELSRPASAMLNSKEYSLTVSRNSN